MLLHENPIHTPVSGGGTNATEEQSKESKVPPEPELVSLAGVAGSSLNSASILSN